MNSKFKKLVYLSVIAVVGVSATVSQAGIVIVANKNLPVSSITVEEARDIFLGKKVEIGGVSLKPMDQQDGDFQKKFNNDVLNKSPDQIKAYWSRLIFTGKGVPPEKMGGDTEIVNSVSTTPGGIGYINDSAVNSSVKVVLTLP